MSATVAKPGPLLIRKYPNRRYYDSTRSCHVTQNDLHALIADGYDVVITDATTAEDITNVVLTQMILDHHAAKLAVFPPAILHQVIRTQQQFLGGIFEQFFRQAAEAQRATQAQWADFFQRSFGMATPPGMDWMSPFRASAPKQAPAKTAEPSPGETAQEESATHEKNPDELTELRRQLAELSRKVEDLSGKKKG